MVDYIKLRKGLDIPIEGAPNAQTAKSIVSDTVALKPTDFKGLIPKLVVKEGDTVMAGDPLFVDKTRPQIKFTSPVSGVVSEIVRGEKRKLLEVRVKADSEIKFHKFELPQVESISKEEVINVLLESGLWAGIKQRPYGTIPSPEVMPKEIFISGFNTSPLGADFDYTLRDELTNIQTAINAFAKVLPGKIHFSLNAQTYASTPFHKLQNVQFHKFHGPHPAGNVGVQIHHISPINKGEVVWTIDLNHLAIIGRLFNKGICDYTKTIAVCGPRAKSPCYVKGIVGMPMKGITEFVSEQADPKQGYQKNCPVRFISGDVLTGKNVGNDGYLGFFDSQITLLTEGNYYEGLGWAKIFRPKKFSFSRTYFSWLCPKKQYNMDTNLNGGERAFVVNGNYEKVLPMDIYPVYLLKAILAGDIDKMEQLGIYEVIEEDFALCEYICPSKIEIQSIISDGIDLMLKEMA